MSISEGKHLQPFLVIGRLFVHAYRLFDSYSINQSLLTGSFFLARTTIRRRQIPLTQRSSRHGWIVAAIIHPGASDKSLGYLRCVDRYLQNVLALRVPLSASHPWSSVLAVYYTLWRFVIVTAMPSVVCLSVAICIVAKRLGLWQKQIIFKSNFS